MLWPRNTGIRLLTRVTCSGISKVSVSAENLTFCCTDKVLRMFLLTFCITVVAVVVSLIMAFWFL